MSTTANGAKPLDLTVTVDESGCHICTSHAADAGGYPQTKKKGKAVRLHRVIYEEVHGQVPAGRVVSHSCGNRMCLNPAHLVARTPAEVAVARVDSGRSAKGTRNGRAKLTEDAVRAIRGSAESRTALARRFGVDPRVIRDVQEGRTWAHVT